MLTCASCEKENPEGFAFCGFCSAPLVPVASDVRKTVTILFCDLTDSTVAGERLDPEVLSGVMTRFMGEMATAVERHGGTVAKFAGDGVMAVFGIPHAHEDDALRAVRAAAEMRDALETLGREVESDLGVSLRSRVGVNTGEVLVAAGNADVLGDPVNTASRLETAATPGEVFIGDPTYQLVRDAVVAEPMEPLVLKGKAERVSAYRLVRIASLSPMRTRRLDAPMIGRTLEMTLLAQAFERAAAGRGCRLFTVLGTAGTGKSRLIEEFLGSLDGAVVLRGHCLPYGDGITYFPVAEVIKGALGLADFDDESIVQERIHVSVALEDRADAITANLAKLLGAGEEGTPEETFWAIRRFFEIQGRAQPLVVVFDDIQWGEQTFLDLIEHVADRSREAHILILCMARPDLMDERPTWAEGKTNATTISLAPLTEQETTELIDHLLGEAGLPGEVKGRIASVAEGNPLFVEEMLRMLIDDGSLVREGDVWVAAGDLTDVSIPPTISALLSARLDRLSNAERQVIERAAVEGRGFHRGAVVALLPEDARESVDEHLRTLARKELISAERSSLTGEDAYRFRHLLIRDAAYDQIPKKSRASLHVGFADWLEGVAGDRIAEQEEIVGYHLERAWRYRDELGLAGDDALRLRAGKRLGSAGERVYYRWDVRAAVDLLTRAADLLEGDDLQLDVLILLYLALDMIPSIDESRQVAERLHRAARNAGDVGSEVIADVFLHNVMVVESPERWSLEVEQRLYERQLRIYRDLGWEPSIPYALMNLASVARSRGDMAATMRLATEALDLALDVGTVDLAVDGVNFILLALLEGPGPLSEAEHRASEFLESFPTDRLAFGGTLMSRAEIRLMLGRPNEARADADLSKGILDDLGVGVFVPHALLLEGLLAWLEDGPEAAEGSLASAWRIAEGSIGYLEVWKIGGPLARVLLELDRNEDASTVVERIRRWAVPGGTMCASGIDALILARAGRFPDAELLLEEAERIAAPTDLVVAKAQLALDRAEVMQLEGRSDEARAAAEDALVKYEQKEHVVGSRQAQALLASL